MNIGYIAQVATLALRDYKLNVKKEVKIGEPMIRTQAIELIVILFLPLTKRNFANK